MEWIQVNGSLTMTQRQPSGYEYRIREQADGTAVLIAEGRISDGKPPTRRLNCVDSRHAMQLALQIERDR